MRQFITCTCALVLTVAGQSLAAAPAAAQVEASAALVSRYMWRGIDVLESRSAVQPSLSYALGASGLSASVWTSFALADRHEALSPTGSTLVGELDQVNLAVAYSRVVGPVAVTMGLEQCNWPRGESWGSDWPAGSSTSLESFASLALDALPGAPSLSVYYDLNSRSAGRANGAAGYYANLAATHAQPLTGGLTLDLSASAGYLDQGWLATKGVSDVNLGAATTFATRLLAVTPALQATYRPWADTAPYLLTAAVHASWKR